jgi:hypothetical protein
MKKTQSLTLFLILYVLSVVALYVWVINPVFRSPRRMTETNIPILSVAELEEAEMLFGAFEKNWADGFPTEPNLSEYTFGQKDPL